MMPFDYDNLIYVSNLSHKFDKWNKCVPHNYIKYIIYSSMYADTLK